MKNTGGALSFDATINDSDFKKTIDSMAKDLNRLTKKAETEANQLDQVFNKLARGAASAFAGLQLSQLPMQIVKVRGEFQQLEIALNTMLQSSERGGKLMQEIVQTAATTPFSLQTLAQGTKQMLAYGSTAETVVGELRMLGDVASGVSIPLGDLVYLYGTLRAQGRAYAVDIRQFAGRGIPIYAELAKVLGVNVDQINDLVSAGKVGFPEVEQAFKNMTAAGSMFGGLMEQQSKSIPGLIERLKDSIAIMYNEIGKENQGLIEGTIKLGATMVENYRSIGSALTVLIGTYGAYRAALAVVAARDAVIASSKAATLYLEMSRGLGTLTAATYANATAIGVQTKAQALFNAVSSANPWVIGITAIVGMTAVMWALHDSTTAQERAQDLLNKRNQEAADSLSKMKSESSSLVSIIRDENQTNYARNKAYDELKSKYKEVIGGLTQYQIQALSTADAQKLLNQMAAGFEGTKLSSDLDKARADLKRMEEDLKRARAAAAAGSLGGSADENRILRNIQAQEKVISDLGKQQGEYNKAIEIGNMSIEQRADKYKKEISNLEATKQKLIDAQSWAGKIEAKKLENSIQRINKLLDETNGKLNDVNKQLEAETKGSRGGNKSFWEGEVTRLTSKRDTDIGIKDIGSKEWKDLTQQIKNAQKEVDKYSLKEAKVAERDKPQPFGSIAYWNQVARKAKEASEKINPDKDPGKFNALDERRKIAELNAEYAKANLMPYGSIEYWETIERISQNILKQTPATDTSGISAQKDIIANAQKQAEEIRKSTAVRSFDQELEYKRQQYELYEKWATQISKDQADSQFKSLIAGGQSFSDFLQFEIEKMKGKIDLGEAIDVEQFDKLKEALRAAEFAKTPFEEFEKRLDAISNSAESAYEEIVLLDKEMSKISPSDTSQFANQIRSVISDRRTDAYNRMSEDLQGFLREVSGSEQRRTQIQAKYENLRQALSKAAQDGRVKDHRKALDDINKAESDEIKEDKKAVREKSKEYKAILKIANKYYADITDAEVQHARYQFKILTIGLDKESDEYKAHYNDLLDIEDKFTQKRVENIRSIADAAGNIGNAMSALGGDWEGIGNIMMIAANNLQAVSSAISEINKSSTESGGFNIKKITSIISLITQVLGAVFDAVKKINEQSDDFDKNLYNFRNQYKLLQNEAIGNQNNSNPFMSDFSNTIKSSIEQYKDAVKQYNAAISDLQYGNAITGFRGGLFVRKSKRFITDDLLKTYPDLVDEAGNLNRELAQILISTGQVDEMTKQLLETAISWDEQMEDANAKIIDSITSITGLIGDDLADAMVNAFKAGEDGAKAMSDVLSGIIENYIKQNVLLEIFRPALDAFSKGVTESYSAGGDGNIIDDLEKLNSTLPGLYAIGSEIMKSARDEGLKNGMDIFGSKDKGTGQDKTLSGAIKGMSQETASVLAGQFNAIRIYQAQMATDMRVSVSHLSVIANNTSYNSNLTLLNDIRDEINGLRKDMKGRAFG